nr:integrase DNA-binding domain-containing protein [[Clostridium] hylemonae]
MRPPSRTGESQRKDGRYAYKYINAFGEPKLRACQR